MLQAFLLVHTERFPLWEDLQDQANCDAFAITNDSVSSVSIYKHTRQLLRWSLQITQTCSSRWFSQTHSKKRKSCNVAKVAGWQSARQVMSWCQSSPSLQERPPQPARATGGVSSTETVFLRWSNLSCWNLERPGNTHFTCLLLLSPHCSHAQQVWSDRCVLSLCPASSFVP